MNGKTLKILKICEAKRLTKIKPKSDKLCKKLAKIRKNWQFCTDIVWFLCQNVIFLLNIYAGKIYKSNKKNKKVFARIFDVLTETLKIVKEAVLCWILSPSSIESEMA